MEEGREVPEDLAADVPEGGEAFYAAFWWLHQRRMYDMNGNPGGISATEIIAYSTAQGLDVEDAMYLVGQLDDAWRERHFASAAKDRARAEKKKEPKKAKAIPAEETE